MTVIGNDLSFGTLLQTIRRRRGLTQQELAGSLGVHRRTLVRWEQGDYLPENKALVLEMARLLALDDQEARQLLEASLTALAPPWLVPLPRNPFFTGREKLLETLHRQLRVEQAAVITQSSALHGLGGVGKTQIALEYAYRYALEYRAVFWIGSETEEQIILSLLHIAEVLQLSERDTKDQQHMVAAVQRWLATHGQWLLIWDNVEELTLLDRFLPSSRSGAILITTRRQILGTFARGLNLLPMEQEEGMLFLLRRAKVLAPDATSEQMHQLTTCLPAQYAATEELVQAIGGLPLALDQAGAYLEATRCGVPAYLDLFRARCALLLQQRGEGARDHPASVSTTFTLAIATSAKCHPAVWSLLCVCALLHPDAIPEELFRQGGEHLGAPLQALCRDALEWNQVVAAAGAYSLVYRQSAGQMLSLHRLIQAVLLDAMTKAEREQWSKRVLAALEAVFPEILLWTATEYTVWKQCERLLPHVLLCLHRTEVAEQDLTFASLAYKVAQYLSKRGRYAEAEPLSLRALCLRERVLGSDHLDVAASLYYLALLYVAQGRYAEAELLLQRALHIQEQLLGVKHPDVATSLNDLAILYWRQGRYAESELLFQRALHIWEQTLGPEHPRVAASLNNLAVVYIEQGRYAEAEPLPRRALAIQEQTLGPEHPRVATSLDNLAVVFMKQGKDVEAKSFLQRAVSIREQTLGADHPQVADLLNTLANLSREQGKDAEAESLYQRVLSIREQYLGMDHPNRAETLHDFAILRQKQGNLNEATSLVEYALHIRSQALGEHHPQTVATRTLYAHLVQEREGAEAPSHHGAEEPSSLCVQGPVSEHLSYGAPEKARSTGAENDPLQGFLDASCELHPRAWCRSADLWQAYDQWVAEHQERFPLSRRAFAVRLKAHGFRADHTHEARIWRGITLVKGER